MQDQLISELRMEISELKRKGLFRETRILETEQAGKVKMDGKDVVMFSSNNYLGLASHQLVKKKAIEALENFGCGTASGPQTSGTTRLHEELSTRVASFTGCEAALIFNSCTSANVGLLTSITTDKDVILSDQYNHASIIDGCRLSRAETKVYAHNDMNALEKLLKESQDRRLRIIITDGVFSMEGDLAPLDRLVELGKRYDAVVIDDDSHGTGVLGKKGRGTPEYFGLEDQLDIQTSTFGKAMGAAAGGYVAGKKELIDYLFNRARSFIYTNALPPSVAATALAALEVVEEHPELRELLFENTGYFRKEISKLGYQVLETPTPILPIMIGDSALALKMSKRLFEEGIFIKGFTFPTVPQGKARLRAQLSAAHSRENLDFSIEAFRRVGDELHVLA